MADALAASERTSLEWGSFHWAVGEKLGGKQPVCSQPRYTQGLLSKDYTIILRRGEVRGLSEIPSRS